LNLLLTTQYVLLCHIICVGLINAHTHLSMANLKGIADDKPLFEWLNEHIWPAEGKWMSDQLALLIACNKT
jgi:5-methylthioadenosine/S-adenosylhomocysteine deaminase